MPSQAEEYSHDQTADAPPPPSYIAPYHPNPESTTSNLQHYIVVFQPWHTLALHHAFLCQQPGVDLSRFVPTPLDNGYFAYIPDARLLEAVRRDHGVRYVEDDALGTWY